MKRFLTYQLLFFILFTPKGWCSEIIDLTHAFNKKTIYWPTAKGFQLKKIGWKTTEKGYFYAANTFCAPEHGGTHIDAPIHFSKGRYTIDQIPVEQLVGEAVVIDLQEKVGDNSDYLISKKDIQEWEKKNRALGKNDIVLLNTGWSRFWGKKKKYLGTAKFRDIQNLHFPGISKQAAEYFVEKGIKGVGLDTPSLDYGQSKDFLAHRVLLDANIYGLENVAHLDQLPPTGAQLYVAPMKIEEGTGAPVRIFAVVP